MQLCSAVTPGATARGVVADGVVGLGTVGTVVVVVVGTVTGTFVGTVVVVVVVVGGAGASVLEGTLEGTVVVGTVAGVVVVDVVAGAVEVVAVLGTSVAGVLAEPVGVEGDGVDAAMVTVAQTPACSSAPASFMSKASERLSAASSDVSFRALCVTALAASSRCCSELLTARSAVLSRVIRLDAASPRYCCAATPFWLWGVFRVSGWELPELTSGALEYNPLLTYSPMANLLRALDAASNSERAAVT
jgi:hypothetical protein